MILLLAGTREARELSFALKENVIASLAGATQRPAQLGGETRIGGFGGVQGLQKFIKTNGVRLVVDATHPFAARMSQNAAHACIAAETPLLQLVRPPWPVDPAWTLVADLEAAAQALKDGSHAFLATGRASLPAFQSRTDVTFTARVIDDLPGQFPLAKGQFLVSHPPFTIDEEMTTLRDLGVDTLVSRNSGGTGGIEKMIAAKELGLNIIVIKRPELPKAYRVENVDDALAFIKGRACSDA